MFLRNIINTSKGQNVYSLLCVATLSEAASLNWLCVVLDPFVGVVLEATHVFHRIGRVDPL